MVVPSQRQGSFQKESTMEAPSPSSGKRRGHSFPSESTFRQPGAPFGSPHPDCAGGCPEAGAVCTGRSCQGRLVVTNTEDAMRVD